MLSLIVLIKDKWDLHVNWVSHIKVDTAHFIKHVHRGTFFRAQKPHPRAGDLRHLVNDHSLLSIAHCLMASGPAAHLQGRRWDWIRVTSPGSQTSDNVYN